jgi:hypothetical protein
MLDWRYYELGKESFSAVPSVSVVGQWSRDLEVINREYVAMGMKTERAGYKYDAKPLDFPHRFMSFKGENGTNRVELYYLISGSEIELYETTTVNFLRLEQFLGFYDDQWHESLRLTEPYIRKVPFTTDSWKSQALVDMSSFSIAPGKYSYEFQVKDVVSQKMAVYRSGYEVTDYNQNLFMMSDLLLSGTIGVENENSTFKKGEIAYSPHMFTSYEQGEEVGLYFELYNLLLDDLGQTQFRVECTLQPFGSEDPSTGKKVIGFFKNLLGDDDSSVSTSHEYLGNEMDQEIYMNINLGDERGGHYELLVEANDLNSDRKITKKVDFWVK